ncbi:class I SAM-dependent methyltransferase [Clostridium sp. C8-1-8]|uniref:class I SAM-dependent methyltransferase n=1 Tax=Clostridium sp. C8-1-8 TaxID=2698831 RepID=UPI00136CA0E7|nr:class I SAM-dependent methyltransferase [Clostridium sp. C8-1-8]
MFKEHNYTLWGTYCSCGNECSILQNLHHPWIDTSFEVKLKCNSCGKELTINKAMAAAFYDEKILSYFAGVYGKVLDLGCGGGFLSRALLEENAIDKIYGLDIDEQCTDELKDIMISNKFQFIKVDISALGEVFGDRNVDFLVSRDVFMFIEDTDKYFEAITKIVSKEIRQMGWYQGSNNRMKNNLTPDKIVEEYNKRGWTTEIEYLDWYKAGYFIRASKNN